MIAYVKGILEEYTEDGIVVEAGGVGYGIMIPASMMAELPSPGEEVKIFTYYQVTEDAEKLYGFRSREEKQMFQQLIKVNGIGPKSAMSILSAVSMEEIRMAVVTGDVKTLSRAPGLGKKTAEKLILELKDKFSAADLVGSLESRGSAPAVVTDAYTEAVEALVALGYSSAEALKAVRSVDGQDGMSVDEILQAAFQKLAMF